MPINCRLTPISRTVARLRAFADKEGREAGAVDAFLEIMRRRAGVVLAGQRLDAASSAGCQWLSEPGSIARQKPGIGANGGARDPASGQDVRDLEGIADRTQRGRVDAPQSSAAARSVPPSQDGFRIRRYRTRARERAIPRARQTRGRRGGHRCDRRGRDRRGRGRRSNRRSEDGSRPGSPKTRRPGCSRPGSAGHATSECGNEKCLDRPGCLPRRVRFNDRRTRSCTT